MVPISRYATSSNGYYVYANITWDDNLLVTVNLTDVNAGWCVKIRGTSTIKCSGSMSDRTSTFYADYDGQEFVLQVYDGVEESFVNSGNPIFAVTNNGNSSGGDDSGSGDSGSVSTYYFYYTVGEGTFLTVARTWNEGTGTSGEGEISSGTSIIYNDYFDVTVGALEGYTDADVIFSNFEIEWAQPNNDGSVTYHGAMLLDNDITAESRAAPIHGIHIDDGTNFNQYYCYIDNGKSNPETISENCEIVGHKSFWYYPELFPKDIYSNNEYNMDKKEYASAYYDANYNTPVNYSYVLAFKAPRYVTHPVNFAIDIQANSRVSGHIGDYPTMNYALCSSDLNYKMYAKSVDQLSENGFEDGFEIVHGTFSLNDINKNDTNKIIINEVSLNQKDETYYLFIWDDERIPHYTEECPIYFSSASQHTITCTYVANQFDLYIPYIDNGTSWESL